MMHTQDWTIGKRVKVGFLTLTIVGREPGIRSQAYTLQSDKGLLYTFEAYEGLRRKDDKKRLING